MDTFPALALVRRELLSSVRRPRSFVLLVGFVLAAVLAVYVIWPDDGRIHVGIGETARGIASLLVQVLFVACLLIVPALAAGSIVIEREQDTFDLLRVSLISTGGLMLGKLLNSVGLFALLVCGAAPVVSVAFFLIGIEWRELFQAVTLLTATAMSCASIGILSSAFFRRSGAAIAGSYAGLLLLMCGGPILSILVALFLQPVVLAFGVNMRQVLGQTMLVGSPHLALNLVFSEGLGWFPYMMAMGYQALFTGLAMTFALKALWRPSAPPRIEGFKPIDDPVLLHERRTTFPFYLIDPLKRKAPIEDGRNAMLVKELRWGILNRTTLLVRIFYAAAIAYFSSGVLMVYLDNDFDSLRAWLFFELACTVTIAPAVLANTLTKEYESGNMDMLRNTLLTSGNILVGKLVAGGVSMVPLILAALLSGIPVVTQGRSGLGLLAAGQVSIVVSTFVCLSLSLLSSLLTKKSVTALMTTYALTLTLFYGTCFIPSMMTGTGSNSEWRWSNAFASPLYLFMNTGAFERFSRVGFAEWSVNTAMYLLLSFSVLGACVHGFRRYRYCEE